AADLKNIVDAQLAIGEQRTKKIGRVAKAASEIGSLVFDGLVSKDVARETVAPLMEELQGLMGQAEQTGDYTGVENYIDQVGAQTGTDLSSARKKVKDLKTQTQTDEFQRILQESGSPAAIDLLSTLGGDTDTGGGGGGGDDTFTDPNGISRKNAVQLGAGTLAGLTGGNALLNIPVANPLLKSVGAQAAKVPLRSAVGSLARQAGIRALPAVATGARALAGPVGFAAGAGTLAGTLLADQPFIADPLQNFFKKMMLQSQINSGQLGPQVQQDLIREEGLQQPRPAVQGRFSQFGGGAL
ncbi:MAG: hypothetical protein ACW987_14715, partial [Candidatus Thorarchaeota archaeon]